MPKDTFFNIPSKKQTLILDALLEEFSKVKLSEAKVSNIIKKTGIARGTFYKYFEDINDAYRYLFKKAMIDIHQNIVRQPQEKQDANFFVKETADFLNEVLNHRYYNFIKMDMLYNHITDNQAHPPNFDPITWSVAELCHSTIKNSLKNPTNQKQYLDNLKVVLEKLLN
ncbi:hypothetical protein FC40_GL001513 [Ligilactobacillus hayakitensis DSM 18933 = JCM 14209]|uniref:HTH tetR-type domain-containing protein n=1 Tax=Ligilactobacillus hayakitensis DSM 18933 = JCM 14209 TaxID=1423755 RepID=A0A0R1WPJ7_9LACO|nr:TetR/AcrR family transcriptional regulator [Ligilactobacillus hayakitensis]KRM19662.1 hypothetical protein FC40_GL001513 [Ligilactobacillus hayakitensis DSM 18933 = JCM 14209]